MSPPDFVIAGAYRAGTTTLRTWLADHPEIFMPSLAEPSFFAFDQGNYPRYMLKAKNDPFRRRRTTTWEQYLHLFDAAPPGAVVGECSPEYLRAPGSASRLADALPNCRVILSLRNPADRLISDWKMCRRDGVEDLGLRQAVDAVEQRDAQGEFGGHYLATSRYTQGLLEFFDEFPRSSILVLIQERWTASPDDAARRLGEFLDIDSALFERQLPSNNRSGVPTSRLAKLAWSMRRRAAPLLSSRVPRSVRTFVDHRLESMLDSSVEGADRDHVRSLLAEEIASVSRLIGDEVPEWT